MGVLHKISQFALNSRKFEYIPIFQKAFQISYVDPSFWEIWNTLP